MMGGRGCSLAPQEVPPHRLHGRGRGTRETPASPVRGAGYPDGPTVPFSAGTPEGSNMRQPDGKDMCDRCGKPAEYVEKGERGALVCGVCVHADAGERTGERFGAATMFMVAAQAAHDMGLVVSDLHALVTEALNHAEESRPSVDVPWLSSLEESRAERSWLKRVEPIEEEVA